MGIFITSQSVLSRYGGSFQFLLLTPQTNNGAWAASGENTQDPCKVLCTNGAGANGNNATWSIFLPAGTYDVWLSYRKGANEGIIDTSIDGTNINTGLDKYAAAAAYGSLVRLSTGTAITTDGKHDFKITVNGKNAGSSGYYGSVSFVVFVRTA